MEMYIDIVVDCCHCGQQKKFQLSDEVKVRIFSINFTFLAPIMVITKTVLSCMHSLDQNLKDFPSFSS